MKINDLGNKILTEGIEVHGYEFVAYCIVIAEEYKKLPKFNNEALKMWEQVIAHNEKMLKKILSSVDVVFTDEDPYKNQREMMYDILVNHTMKIFKTPSDDEHTGMTAFQNDVFRAVHDYFGHYVTNEKEFADYLIKHNIKSPSDNKLKRFRFSRNNFTVRGEINTYISHGKLLPDELKPVLFTEIVGQICTYFVTGNYTVNKTAIMEGVDFKNIGYFTDGTLEKRKYKYMKLLENPEIEIFKTQLGIFDKQSIKWNMLSRGEGVKRKNESTLKENTIKFKKQGGHYITKDGRIEIIDNLMTDDKPEFRWTLKIDDEWIEDSNRKKDLVQTASKMIKSFGK